MLANSILKSIPLCNLEAEADCCSVSQVPIVAQPLLLWEAVCLCRLPVLLYCCRRLSTLRELDRFQTELQQLLTAESTKLQSLGAGNARLREVIDMHLAKFYQVSLLGANAEHVVSLLH